MIDVKFGRLKRSHRSYGLDVPKQADRGLQKILVYRSRPYGSGFIFIVQVLKQSIRRMQLMHRPSDREQLTRCIPLIDLPNKFQTNLFFVLPSSIKNSVDISKLLNPGILGLSFWLGAGKASSICILPSYICSPKLYKCRSSFVVSLQLQNQNQIEKECSSCLSLVACRKRRLKS